MFDRLFQHIRTGVRDAILGGFQDAHDELTRLVETGEPLPALESPDEASKANGKATSTRRKAATKG